MVASLVAWDAAGRIIATLDSLVAQDELGNVTGLVDFEAHELAGGQLTDIWRVSNAAGSGTWPEFLGERAHEFTVERSGGRITALVHGSGHRRERLAVEAAIRAREAVTQPGEPVDIRDIVGGPQRPLRLDDQGRTLGRAEIAATPVHLPLIHR